MCYSCIITVFSPQFFNVWVCRLLTWYDEIRANEKEMCSQQHSFVKTHKTTLSTPEFALCDYIAIKASSTVRHPSIIYFKFLPATVGCPLDDIHIFTAVTLKRTEIVPKISQNRRWRKLGRKRGGGARGKKQTEGWDEDREGDVERQRECRARREEESGREWGNNKMSQEAKRGGGGLLWDAFSC